MKKISTKRWRLNYLVTYDDQICADYYRFDILQLLKHLSSIYKLDYAIAEEHQFASGSDGSEQPARTSITDLVYFRSNQNTLVDPKELRSIISCMFYTRRPLFFEAVQIYTQLYKVLIESPFPTEFYRHLESSFVEYHQGRHITRYIYAADLLKVIEKEQDFPLN